MKLLAENYNTKVYQKDNDKPGLLIIHQGEPGDTRDTLVANLSGIWPNTGKYLLTRVTKRDGAFDSHWTGFIPSYKMPDLS
jgi:hypothetical protein